MEDIKVGDVVILKSGGPKMTISSINDAGVARCRWFEKNETLQRAEFIT